MLRFVCSACGMNLEAYETPAIQCPKCGQLSRISDPFHVVEPLRCVVTGAAGFIGSHLCERLTAAKHDVVGIDSMSPYYSRVIKEQNLALLRQMNNFEFHELDLRTASLEEVLIGADVIFHLAGMAGLMPNWTDFEVYSSYNLTATHRLVQAATKCRGLRRFVFASTSSVYGLHARGDETLPLRPASAYGVTKLAAENLCRACSDEEGLPLIVLRLFSVYGPRQRPDMGFYRFIQALLHGQPISIYGDGSQMRGNTYVSDCVEATVKAMESPVGETYNIGGGECASVREIIARLERIIGRKAELIQDPSRPGDQLCTLANTGKFRARFGWSPKTTLWEGLERQVASQLEKVQIDKVQVELLDVLRA